MRLTGIYAPPGAVVGRDHSGQLLAAGRCDTSDMLMQTLPLRPATIAEITSAGRIEPYTVYEHERIPVQQTVYGPAKVLGHNGFMTDKRRREMNKLRRQLRHLKVVQ